MTEVHHETVYFRGRVQGVGFRYQAMQLAREYDVSGYVQNLPDGRVRLEVEGTPEETDAFILAVIERMTGHIRGTERSGGRRHAEFSGFAVR
jgi:acylphosphatase